jgi:hypothetical protein
VNGEASRASQRAIDHLVVTLAGDRS